MEPLIEKLIANKKLHEVCLTTKWLSAGFPISGDFYKIEAHADKRKPKKNKGFNIELSCYYIYDEWYIQFKYGKYLR